MRMRWSGLGFAILVLGASAGPSRAADLAAVLEGLSDNARFEPAMRADVRFESPRPEGPKISTLMLYGRGRTVRLDMPDGKRALVKPGKGVFMPAGEPPRDVKELVIGGSAFLLEDLAPFTVGRLRIPLISDEDAERIVVTGEPLVPSAYVLLVYTIPLDRPLIRASKFYRYEVSNLTKMMHVQDAVQVAGHWRPRVIVLQDLGPGGDITNVTFDWHEQPDLPAAAFTPRGLRAEVPR
jgi:hypothetical protein